MVIINPLNGKIEKAKVFDTYKNGEKFDKFISGKFPEGHIVVVAVKDDCTGSLSDLAK